jgi:hypothetical protein
MARAEKAQVSSPALVPVLPPVLAPEVVAASPVAVPRAGLVPARVQSVVQEPAPERQAEEPVPESQEQEAAGPLPVELRAGPVPGRPARSAVRGQVPVPEAAAEPLPVWESAEQDRQQRMTGPVLT